MIVRFFIGPSRLAISLNASRLLVVLTLLLCGRPALADHGPELYVSILSDDLTKVQELIHDDPDLVFNRSCQGRSPLYWAAFFGYPDIVQFLLDKQAFINEEGYMKMRPVQVAAYMSDEEIRKWPATTGAVNHKAALELLLKNGAYPDEMTNEGKTALYLAASKNMKDIAQVLLSYGANVNAQDNRGLTPLAEAANKGHLDFAELLLDHKADINLQDKDGNSPLLSAVNAGTKDLVRFLLAHHAQTEVRDNLGNTALQNAAGHGQKEIVEMLLAAHAEVNTVNQIGATPFCYATNHPYLNIMTVLFANGADINRKCTYSRRPLRATAAFKHPEVAEFLRQHGAHE